MNIEATWLLVQIFLIGWLTMKKTFCNYSKIYQLLILFALGSLAASIQAKDLTMSQQALQQKQLAGQTDLLLLDVRSAAEFKAGHVPGAVNIPHHEIDTIYQLLQGADDKDVVVYCRSGRRAGLVLEAMKAKGLEGLYHLEGDMNGWSTAGLPIEK